MGHKIHPGSLRLPITKQWMSRWFAPKKEFAQYLKQDILIREAIAKHYGANSGISKIIIERNPQEITLTINTSKPGILIGRGGKGINDIKLILAKLTESKLRLNVIEIKRPDLEANIVAASIGQQITKRISYRRAAKQAAERVMQAGAKGVKITISGRLQGADIARTETISQGTMPTSSLKKDIDFTIYHAITTYGIIGVKVWIHKGDLNNASDQQQSSRALI